VSISIIIGGGIITDGIAANGSAAKAENPNIR
jgi:hypothetical protein